MVLSMGGCGWSCWEEAECGSVISSVIGEDATIGYFISLLVSDCPNPWRPK